MKLIPLKTGTTPYNLPDGSTQTLNSLSMFAAMAMNADGGLTLDQLRVAVQLRNTIDVFARPPEEGEKPHESIMVTDAEWAYLAGKMQTARWNMVDPFIVEVTDDVLNAEEIPRK